MMWAWMLRREWWLWVDVDDLERSVENTESASAIIRPKSHGGRADRVATQSPLASCHDLDSPVSINFILLPSLRICQEVTAFMGRTAFFLSHSTTVAFIWFTSAALFFILFQMALHNSTSASSSGIHSFPSSRPLFSLFSVHFQEILGFVWENEWNLAIAIWAFSFQVILCYESSENLIESIIRTVTSVVIKQIFYIAVSSSSGIITIVMRIWLGFPFELACMVKKIIAMYYEI